MQVAPQTSALSTASSGKSAQIWKTFLDMPIKSLLRDRQTRNDTEIMRSRILPPKLGPKLISVSDTATATEAFALLKENNILALPVYQGQSKTDFVAIISAIDLLQATILGPAFEDIGVSHSPIKAEENTEMNLEKELAAWMEKHIGIFNKITVKQAIGKTPESGEFNFMALHTDEPMARLMDVMTSGVHRVLVYEQGHEGDENWYTIVSQTDLVWYINVNRDKLPAELFSVPAAAVMQVASKPFTHPYMLYDLDSGATRPGPVIVLENAPTAMVLRLMSLFKTSCVGIVNEQGNLVGNLSGADFRGFNGDAIHNILKPVAEYIREMQHVNPADCSPVCLPNTSLKEVIETILRKKVHRVWVGNDDRVDGLITMSDILTTLNQSNAVNKIEE
ncbi:hypothetical protein DFS34DRAFT_675154 [Phlyctochytrium arcticum]|nr:hypothetical protein DFS34DRAFT_675154 [Phlyctochytrium arcticum]